MVKGLSERLSKANQTAATGLERLQWSLQDPKNGQNLALWSQKYYQKLIDTTKLTSWERFVNTNGPTSGEKFTPTKPFIFLTHSVICEEVRRRSLIIFQYRSNASLQTPSQYQKRYKEEGGRRRWKWKRGTGLLVNSRDEGREMKTIRVRKRYRSTVLQTQKGKSWIRHETSTVTKMLLASCKNLAFAVAHKNRWTLSLSLIHISEPTRPY